MASMQPRVQSRVQPTQPGPGGPGATRGPQFPGPSRRRDAVRPAALGIPDAPAPRGARGAGGPVRVGCRPVERSVRAAVGGPDLAGREGGSPPAAPPALRLTRRGRRMCTALLVLIGVAIALVAGSMLLGGGDDGGLRLAGSTTVVVEPGDTLWSIAGAVAPGQERRGVVDAIAELNHLPAGQVQAGQVLLLP